MAYQKFAGNKTLAQIKAQCKAQGVVFDDSMFRDGSDYVALRSPGVVVLFNTFNGSFFGKTPEGIEFSSDDKRDGTPWFDALLHFFYATEAGA